MNILLINHYAGSVEMGMEFRPFYVAKELKKHGYNVTILASEFSHLRKHNPEIVHDFEESYQEGVQYVWVKAGHYEGNGKDRALSMFRFVKKVYTNAKKIVEKYKPDVVICSSTYPLDTYAGQKIAKLSGAKLIHEIHDMWPATLYEIGGMSKKHPFVMLMAMGEKSFVKHSDKVVSMLPFTKDYLVEKGMKPEKWSYIPNGVVLEDWSSPSPLPGYLQNELEKLKINHSKLIGYFGGHALSNALDLYLDAIKLGVPDEVGFVFVGDGVEKERLVQKVDQEKIKNIYFFDSISKLAIPTLLNFFDAIYIGGYATPLYRFGGSLNKMYDALYAGKPIILAMDLPGNPVIEAQGNRYTVLDSDIKKINEVILDIIKISDKELAKIREESIKIISETYTYQQITDSFIEVFSNNNK